MLMLLTMMMVVVVALLLVCLPVRCSWCSLASVMWSPD